jgi:hypothetical protein
MRISAAAMLFAICAESRTLVTKVRVSLEAVTVLVVSVWGLYGSVPVKVPSASFGSAPTTPSSVDGSGGSFGIPSAGENELNVSAKARRCWTTGLLSTGIADVGDGLGEDVPLVLVPALPGLAPPVGDDPPLPEGADPPLPPEVEEPPGVEEPVVPPAVVPPAAGEDEGLADGDGVGLGGTVSVAVDAAAEEVCGVPLAPGRRATRA